jgi:hypothetical protein
MAAGSHKGWLQRFLFVLSVSVSIALFTMVIVSPAVDNAEQAPKGAARLTAVFARDAMVRRTAIAGGIGLLATACIFFRSAGPKRFSGHRTRPPRLPPPSNIAGA